MKIETLTTESPCYLSTREHLDGLPWRWSLYTDNGMVTLDDSCIAFTGKKGETIRIPLVDIQIVTIGSFPKAAKPLRLDYIEVSYTCGSSRRTILLTPATFWTTVGDANKRVADWYDRLRIAVYRAGALERSSPSAPPCGER